MEENPWKTLSSQVVYKNPWIEVREDQVIRPDGKPGIYGVVESRIATGVVALTPNREVYLVGQYRYPVKEYSWEIIEGGTDDNEDPLTTAKRELQEEAGLVAKRWYSLGGEFHLTNCYSAERAVVFIAEDLSQGESFPEGTEVLKVKRVPLEQAIDMIDTGGIKDAVTIVALLRAEKYLIQGNSNIPVKPV